MKMVATRTVNNNPNKERVEFKTRAISIGTRVYLTAYKTDRTIVRQYRDFTNVADLFNYWDRQRTRFTANGFIFK